MISNLLDKQLLIIVDELDRCKPSYAVELLEIVKHFFTSKHLVFLFACNKYELTNTVKLAYGQNFDGHKYLNRFFDYEFTLPKIDIKNYMKFKFPDDVAWNYVYSNVVIAVCKSFNFSMRDINRYISLCSVVKNFWVNKTSYYSHRFAEIVMTPYAIGLKIHSGEQFNQFINGRGYDGFIKFCEDNKFVDNNLFLRNYSQNHTFNFSQEVKKLYNLFTDNEEADFENETEKYVINEILEVLTMMSDYSTF